MDLTDAYENGAYIEGAEAIFEGWVRDAKVFRETATAQLNISYGPSDREVFDLFLPQCPPQGVMVFVHGGYWKALDKSYWSHFAQGSIARGWAVAMPSYTLCPDIRIAGITAQISQAITHIAGLIDGPIAITGHSAGGHQTARMVMPGVLPSHVLARVRRAIPISALGDLRPLMQTDMNQDLHIDLQEADRESPSLGKCGDVDVHVWVGDAERPAFIEQSQVLATAWGAPLHFEAGAHHFNVIDPLKDPDSLLVSLLLAP